MNTGLAAAACLYAYAKETQRTSLSHLSAPLVEHLDETLAMDSATRKNLELDENLLGKEENTLYAVLNTTATAMGGRLRPLPIARRTSIECAYRDYRRP